MIEKPKTIKIYTVITLGYLGLLPPLIAVSTSLANYISLQESFHFCLLYANIILSFLGGTHWFAGISSDSDAPMRKILSGIFSSLLGLISLVIRGSGGAILTISGLLVLAGIEKTFPILPQEEFEWYLSLRVNLTVGLISLLVVSLCLSS